MHDDFSEFTLVATQAALLAGQILKGGFGSHFKIDSKEGRHNLVTEFDYAAEKQIINFIKERYPDHNFLAEESGKTPGQEGSIQWVIDPLDGTVNFAHNVPMFAVSIAARRGKEILCGVVYNPIANELFTAQKGFGAYLNGKRLSVSKTPQIENAILATGFPYNLIENPHNCIEHLLDVLRMGIPIRRMGVAALDLCYVAAGRFDGFWEESLGAWDCAAGILIIEESGGTVTGWDGSAFDIESRTPICASNSLLHKDLCATLSKKGS